MGSSLHPTEKMFERSAWQMGEHQLHGILIAAGERIQAGQYIRKRRMSDLCPTFLHLLGHAIGGDMNGRLLTRLFTSNDTVAIAPPTLTAPTTEIHSPG